MTKTSFEIWTQINIKTKSNDPFCYKNDAGENTINVV